MKLGSQGIGQGLGLWYLMPLSKRIQLYVTVSFIGGGLGYH
jgi:hypothetical protein